MISTRVLLISALSTLVVAILSGCGGSGASESELAHLRARVAALDDRLTTLEAETRRLQQKGGVTRRVATLEARSSTASKNDEAFYTSVGALYSWVYCGAHPSCHVPLGTPGALHTDDRYPGRIFATPAP